jgi:hypothetical protein
MRLRFRVAGREFKALLPDAPVHIVAAHVRTIAEIGSAITKLANAPHSAVMLAIYPCHTRRNLEIRERTTCADHFALWAIR